jgi:lipoate-protein ligase A
MVAPERHRTEVNSAFGGPVQLMPESTGGGAPAPPAQHAMDLVRQTLQGFENGGSGFLRLYQPAPTAAFSPRDTTLQHYAAAASAVQALGFQPVERRAGGQLAIYDEASLVIDLVAPHSEPRDAVMERFRQFSGVIAKVLTHLGIDARVGEIPGEFCPGTYSVNAEGRIKLVGLAQRIVRRGYHLGAVISVAPSDKARAAVAQAYGILGLPFDPATFGAAQSLVPGLSFTTLCQQLQSAITAELIAVADHGKS